MLSRLAHQVKTFTHTLLCYQGSLIIRSKLLPILCYVIKARSLSGQNFYPYSVMLSRFAHYQVKTFTHTLLCYQGSLIIRSKLLPILCYVIKARSLSGQNFYPYSVMLSRLAHYQVKTFTYTMLCYQGSLIRSKRLPILCYVIKAR